MTLAEVCGKAGQPEEGLKRLAEAAELVETTQERWAEAEITGCQGRYCFLCVRTLRRRIAIAKRLGWRGCRSMPSFWELRAAISIARL